MIHRIWLKKIIQRLTLLLQVLQRFSAFRIVIKLFCPKYKIKEASQIELSALYSWLYPDSNISEITSNPNSTVYIAIHGKKILASAVLTRHPESDFPFTGHWLYGLIIKPKYRGMGIGTALTLYVMDQSRAEKSAEISLFVFEDNYPAISLYHKLGFKQYMNPIFDKEFDNDMLRYGRQRIILKKCFL